MLKMHVSVANYNLDETIIVWEEELNSGKTLLEIASERLPYLTRKCARKTCSIVDEQGKRNGLSEEFDEYNVRTTSNTYRRGILHGVHRVYGADGQRVLIEYNYKNGELSGLYQTWYSNGQVQFRSRYLQGQEHGKQKYYTRDGRLETVETFSFGQEIVTPKNRHALIAANAQFQKQK